MILDPEKVTQVMLVKEQGEIRKPNITIFLKTAPKFKSKLKPLLEIQKLGAPGVQQRSFIPSKGTIGCLLKKI